MFTFVGATALHIACKFNNYDAARHLIARSANVNLPTLQGTTPLHLASENKNLMLIKHLIESGAFINAADNTGETSLHYIINSSNSNNVKGLGEECLSYLLNQNAIDISRTNIVEATPLHLAIVRNQVSMAEMLINCLKTTNEKKAYVNKSDIGKMTPLMLAIYGKHIGLCNTLLDAGADANCIISSDNAMDNNLMPLHIACMSNLPTLIERLIPITNLSMIRNLLKCSPDKACAFRICHENLGDDLLDVKQSMKCLFNGLRADEFVTLYGQQIPKSYPTDESDSEQPTYEVFWFLAEYKHILPYVGETPLSHYLRNSWDWLDKYEKGYDAAFEILIGYIENGSSVNQIYLDECKGYTIPPLLALCCIGKHINLKDSKLIAYFEKIVDYMVNLGATIPNCSLTFICISSQPIIFKILCERGVIKPEDIDIEYVVNQLKLCFHSKFRLPRARCNHMMSLLYYLHFFDSNGKLKCDQINTINDYLEKLYETYKVHDQKLGQSDSSLVNEKSLLKQCRIVIRNRLTQVNPKSIVNINVLIKRLPGLPLDLYDFLCMKTLKINMKK